MARYRGAVCRLCRREGAKLFLKGDRCYKPSCPIEKRGTVVDAPPEFMLVVSYNPGYQSILKDLKQSTRQRFIAMEFDYPPAESETEIVAKEGGIDEGNPPLQVDGTQTGDQGLRHRLAKGVGGPQLFLGLGPPLRVAA